MKGITLLFGVSLLVICNAFPKPASPRFNPLKMCGITEEKDATLHKCLSDYREKQRVEMEKLRNYAGEKNFSVVQKIFRDSLKCFTEENSKEKKCYVATMFRLRRAFEIKEHEMEILTAASLFKNFMRFVKVVYGECNLNEDTAPFLVSCIKDLVPEAKKIIAGKVGYESYKRMAELITGTKRCYAKITSEQGLCIVQQSEVYKQNEAKDLKEKIAEMVQKLKNCKISAEEIKDVSTCVKTKGITMLNVSFEKFEKPEYVDEMWNLAEDMKECFDKYPDVEKCKLVKKHDRAPRREHQPMNPFHFENVTNGLINYITEKSKTMLGECKVLPTKMPTLYICLGKKYKENKEVQSSDPKTKFIGMIRLMNESAECFVNVTAEQGLCLLKNKQEMVKFVDYKARAIGKLMDQLLGACKATPEMSSCVNEKKMKLYELSKTILTTPDNAATMWDLGSSLKTCLTDETVKQCVLSKKDRGQARPGKDHGRSGDMDMQKHIVEKSMKMFAECKLSPQNSPAVFMCLKKKFDESKLASLKDPKQMFISGMKLMKTSALCFENATNEQKSCLSNKKNEMQEKISEMSEKFQKVMDQVLLACGVDKSKTPELIQCIEPKRESMKKMIPELFNNPAMAEPAWELMEEAKKCFENKSEIHKCIKEKNMNYYMNKFGKAKKYVPKMEIIEKVQMVFKKCNISAASTPELHACMQTKVDKLKGVMASKDMTANEKMLEFAKLRQEGLKCFRPTDDKRKQCVADLSRRLFMQNVQQKRGKEQERRGKEQERRGKVQERRGKVQEMREEEQQRRGEEQLDNVKEQRRRGPDIPRTSRLISSGGFNIDMAMKSMDNMLAKCGITSEKTPNLKSCLDERTKAVMQIQPWRSMTDEARGKLKAEGVKYWECFSDGQDEEQKCIIKMVEGFKKMGNAARMQKIAEKMDVLIAAVRNDVLACSSNACFEKGVVEASEKVKAYWKSMKAGKNDEVREMRKEISKSLVQGMFCLSELPSFERSKTFSCLQPIINRTSTIIKDMFKPNGGDEGKNKEDTEGLRRSKREAPRIDIFLVMFQPDQSVSMEQATRFLELMRNYLSSCPSPASLIDGRRNDDIPQARRRNDDIPQARKIIDHGGLRRLSSRPIIDHGGLPARPPSDMMMPPASDQMDCKIMYDEINDFVNSGILASSRRQPTETHDKHMSTAVIVAACTGSVIVGVLVLLTIIVIFVTKRRCNSHAPNRQTPPASAPTEAPHSCYGSYPTKDTPPEYKEISDEGKYTPATGFSQILNTSTKEGAEKSC